MTQLRVPSPKTAGKEGSATCRQPTEKPPFDLADVQRAIPPHCFQRSYLKSFSYLFVDLLIVATCFYLTRYIDLIKDEDFGAFGGFVLRHACWTLYWIVNGCVMTGLWVLAHECGHGGFSDSSLVNDTVGLVVHSALLVPYFSWKISHRRHHANNAHVLRDEVFVPAVAPGPLELPHEDAPASHTWTALKRLGGIASMLTLGWPLYLWFNATGRPYQSRWVNHFWPYSPIFSRRERALVLISDAGLVVAAAVLAALVKNHGLLWVVRVYGIPLLIVNFWLVLITFLQHTDEKVPHYDNDEWNYLRGALATVDRDFGILNVVFHHIADTHVVHHLFSDLPHYHAQEATRAVKPLLGKYYLSDSTPIAKALYRSYTRCNVVQADALVTRLDASGKPLPPKPSNESKGVLWFQG